MKLLSQKLRFFAVRFIGLCSLALVPALLLNQDHLPTQLALSLIITLVLFFLTLSYLLAKEVDGLLKLHVKTHSSLDRVLYRVLVGQALLIVYASLLSLLLPYEQFGTVGLLSFVLLVLWHAWPTRKKLSRDFITQDLSEYRYLDGFERTTLLLTLGTVLLSIPSLPEFKSIELFKLYVDPKEYVHHSFWTYLSFLSRSVQLNANLTVLFQLFYWHLSFTLMALLSVYSLLRYFVSRRLALLVVYAMVSSWSYSKGLQFHFLEMLFSSLSLIWIWSFFWTLRSANYRAGFVLGLSCFYAALFHWTFCYLWPAQVAALWFAKGEQGPGRLSFWYRKQFIRYTLVGGILLALSLFSHQELYYSWKPLQHWDAWAWQWWQFYREKSLYLVAPLGFIAFALCPYYREGKIFLQLLMRDHKLHDLGLSLALFMPFGLLVWPASTLGLFALTILSVACLLPLERLFQILHQQRSQRNALYLTYILFCLLDSHLEGRVKVLVRQLELLL